jgi:ammonium transporter Rh
MDVRMWGSATRRGEAFARGGIPLFRPVIICLLLIILLLLLLTPAAALAQDELATELGAEGTTPDTPLVIDEAHKFNKSMDVWFMLMLVAFLMLFIKKFEWGVCLATLLVAASTFISYGLIKEFIWGDPWDQTFILMGVIAAITAVIAIGVFLGTVKMWQYLLAGVMFGPSFAIVEWFMFTFLEGVVDPGGSILVHMMAAYWGWGVILTLREKRSFAEPMNTTTHSISFVWLASMLLWVLWPSFVTALLPMNEVTWGMTTAYMAGMGAIISTYIFCMLWERRVNPLIFTYAMLAGMVAIGSPLLAVGPWGALLIGFVAGALSTTAFVKLQPWLAKTLGVLDVMGVHNLHGVGGWIGALIAAAITAGMANVYAAVGVFVISLVAGGITGIVIRFTRGDMPVQFADDTDFLLWHPEPLEVLPTGEVVTEIPAATVGQAGATQPAV